MPPKLRDFLLLLFVCFIVFWWRLGALGLIDPDEPFYAQTAREMVSSGDWTTPQIFGEPQFEKPIFFYWMTAVSFEVFGETEFAARVSSALPGTLTVLLGYLFSAHLFSRRTALLTGIVMATGLEFALMSRLMLTDIALALFIAGSLFSYWMAMEDESKRTRWLLTHFIFAGLGVLTKGPVATLVTLFTTISFRIITKRPMPYRGLGLWGGLVLYALIAVPWYAIMLMKHGWPYFDSFFIHENIGRMFFAEHPSNNHPFYYVLILLIGSIPWLPVVVLTVRRGIAALRADARQKLWWWGIAAGFTLVTLVQRRLPHFVGFAIVAVSQLTVLFAVWRGAQGAKRDERQVFLWCWLVTSFVFLTITQSKLPSYIFYLFVPLAQVIGIVLDDLLTNGFRSRGERSLVIALSIVQLLATLVVPFIAIAKPFTTPALMGGACFAVALVFLIVDRFRTWIAVNSLAVASLVIGALIVALPEVEAYSSAKPVAAAMMKLRQNSEPLLGGKFLARGIFYYTHQPVSVISNSENPFWTKHPLPVVAGEKGLRKFLDEHGSAIATVRRGEWKEWQKLNLTNGAEPQWFGENAVVRFVKPNTK